LARKTPLKKPNRGEWIVSRKPRQKSVYDFLGLLYFFIVLLYICVVSCPYVIYFPTFMAQYSLFVLKMLLNPKQTNLFIHSFIHSSFITPTGSHIQIYSEVHFVVRVCVCVTCFNMLHIHLSSRSVN